VNWKRKAGADGWVIRQTIQLFKKASESEKDTKEI